MIKFEEIEEYYPCPVRLSCYGKFLFNDHEKYNLLLEKHNRCRSTKIKNISFNYFEAETLSFEIHVGKNLVHKGFAPKNFNGDEECTNFFLNSIFSIMEQVLDMYHDEIIDIQMDNCLRIQSVEKKGYDEMLYAYYEMNGDERAFIYLKKLAKRYPHSDYRLILRRIYSGWTIKYHRKSMKMAKKLDVKKSRR